MGLKFFSDHHESTPNRAASDLPDVNPDPYNFKVINVTSFKNCYVSRIQYPDCTTFEGCKILVTTYDPRSRAVIDPHFHESSGLIARFEPTVMGVELAMKLAEIV